MYPNNGERDVSHYATPAPTSIFTADKVTLRVGDRAHNYYDCKTGLIRDIEHGDVANDGWARLTDNAGSVNGSRMVGDSCPRCDFKALAS
jgi:hypothetical protein